MEHNIPIAVSDHPGPLFKRMFVKTVAFTSDKAKGDMLMAEIRYKEMENQKENADLHWSGSQEVSVCQQGAAECSYIIEKYPYDNELLINASVIDIDKRPGASFSSLTYFKEWFPCLLPVDADIDIWGISSVSGGAVSEGANTSKN